MSSIFQIVLGTAGHIDHGKSSLVRCLTGIDPDRLKEEKERGLTIDLGFAPLTIADGRKVGIIDVPGHEKFVKNMVAGATSIDFVLLVVAADDGIMPQTREHLEIMQLLHISNGMVVITKIDKVTEDLLELAEEEIKEMLRRTFLENASIARVSTLTGEGMEDFKQLLFKQIASVTPHSHEGVFRMPIQRVFSSHGYGTVLTGVPVSGSVHIGDVIKILPGEQSGRIKKIEAYGHDVEDAQAGHSAALNVRDIDYKNVTRGQVAVAPGYFSAAKFYEGKFVYSKNMNRPLGHLTPIRFHTGTSETMGNLAILGTQRQLLPGEEAYVQIRLDDPVLAVVGDRYVIRLSSPTITIGGGVIIGMGDKKLKRFRNKTLEQLEAKEKTLNHIDERIELELKSSATLVKEEDIVKFSQLPHEQLREIIHSLLEQHRIMEIKEHCPCYIHMEVFDRKQERIVQTVGDFFAEHPHRIYVGKSHIQQKLQLEHVLWELLLQAIVAKQLLGTRGDYLFVPGRTVTFTPSQQQTLQSIEKCFLDNIFAPPRREEIPELVAKSLNQTESLMEYLMESEVLVEIAHDIWFHRNAIAKARQLVIDIIQAQGELTPANFRDQLQTSRKYIIPLLEYFDKIGLTIRQGNSRVLKDA